MSVGEMIKLARKNKGLSQDDLAEQLGVNRVSISHYEKGKNNPTHKNLLKLSTILGVQLLDDSMPVAKFIPLIGLASCVIPNDYNLSNYESIPIDTKLYKDSMYAVEVEGDSMSPKINNGNIVYCIPVNDTAELNNKIVHYSVNDDGGIKKLKINEDGSRISLIPLNSDYDIITIDHYENIRLKLSKVVGVVDTNF